MPSTDEASLMAPMSTPTELASLRKERIRALLKGIESGDPKSVEVIHPDTYIQHNPQTHEGRAGLAALFLRLSKTSPRVNIVRIFSDGDYVFGHTEYDFSTRRIGFEVFRFEGDQAVEHWDNIQPRRGPNAAGRSMVDGPTEPSNLEETEANRSLVRLFVESTLVASKAEEIDAFIADDFVEHDPDFVEGTIALRTSLEHDDYQRLHRVLAEGDFVLAVSEGTRHDVHSAFYDLFRVRDGKLAEHWNTVEHVAPKAEWKNDNGKF